jgi:hypothetical protein
MNNVTKFGAPGNRTPLTTLLLAEFIMLIDV